MMSQLLFIIITTMATTPLINIASSFTFTLVPLNLQPNFILESLLPRTKYPYVTPQGEIFLTEDPSDSAHTSLPLYNVGRITYTQPLPIRNSANELLSFSTYLRFTILTSTKYNESGDGIAFAISTDSQPPPNSTGRFLGLMPEQLKDRHQQFMAVEFDTFQNLQPEILDPSASHVGIDISSLASIKPVLNTANPSHPLYLYKNSTITAWISYDASTHLIQVWATNSLDIERPPNPILSSVQNLSRVFENHTNIYAAVTAASGNNSQATILYSWNLNIQQTNSSDPHLPLLFILIIVIVSAILLSVACFFAIGCILKRRKLAVSEQRKRTAIEIASVSVNRYGYNELRRATNNFSEERRIGEGGFSIVYMGTLPDGTVVAIKKMKGGLVEVEEIAREVQIISRIKHRNLLELEGWCYERGEALLVYKYMPNGSLDSYLYGEKRRCGEMLDSRARYKILVGVAAGLDYLHHGLDECVLHRDVKAANVMVTEMMESKLGDFGLARLIAHDEVVTTSTGAGTRGYLAPEVENAGRVTEKADVHSFGALALEVACGRRPLDPSRRCHRLKDWVWLHDQSNTILDALDPRITDEFAMPSLADAGATSRESHEELQKWKCVLHVGLLCCQDDPDMRPYMREVHQALKDCTLLPPPPSWTMYTYPPSSSRTDTETSPRTDPETFLSLPLLSSPGTDREIYLSLPLMSS